MGIGDGSLHLRAAELLCSRLCHDLISPVAAISNGLELLAEDDGSSSDEIGGLLNHSARQAAGRLMFYRTAYGLGGDQADSLTVADAAALVAGIADAEKVSFDWPDRSEIALGRIGIKLLLNAAMMALEAMPRGGRLSVALSGDPPTSIALDASGTGAALRPEVAAALAEGADVSALSARSVHSYFTAWLARGSGGRLSIETRPDSVHLDVEFPPRVGE